MPCSFDQGKSHCPKACNACDDFGCVDSQAPFKFQERMHMTCAELREMDDDNIEKLCRHKGMKTTCRETCKFGDFCNYLQK